MRLALAVAPAALALSASAHAATRCDPLDKAACLLPFPNDAFTRAEKSTTTGRRLALRTALMPRNAKGKPIDPAAYNSVDGFSPGSVILTKVKGLDTTAALPAFSGGGQPWRRTTVRVPSGAVSGSGIRISLM